MLRHAVLVMFALGCGEEASDTTLELGPVEQRFDAWLGALEAGDAEALAGLYVKSGDLVVSWPMPLPGGNGVDTTTWNWADESDAQQALMSTVDALHILIDDQRITETPESAVVAFSGALVITPAGDVAGDPLPIRGSLFFVAQDGGWVIIHEHLSFEPEG